MSVQPQSDIASTTTPPPHPLRKQVARRCPADIYLPCLDGTPTALDFAVAGLQRPESLHQTAQVPVSAAAAYAQVKCNHQDTARLSADQRVRFLPMVSESTGAWDNNGSRTLRVIASAVAAREGQVGSSVYFIMLGVSGLVRLRAAVQNSSPPRRPRCAHRRYCWSPSQTYVTWVPGSLLHSLFFPISSPSFPCFWPWLCRRSFA